MIIILLWENDLDVWKYFPGLFLFSRCTITSDNQLKVNLGTAIAEHSHRLKTPKWYLSFMDINISLFCGAYISKWLLYCQICSNFNCIIVMLVFYQLKVSYLTGLHNRSCPDLIWWCYIERFLWHCGIAISEISKVVASLLTCSGEWGR